MDLPDAPDLTRARRVGDYVGMVNYPDVSRAPGTPGLGLVGDAALTTDYLWGIGCGWALQSAEWLADAVGPALAGSGTAQGVDQALQRYARRHGREFGAHHFLIADGATRRRLNPLEGLMFSAAAYDQRLAANLGQYGSRRISPWQFLAPTKIARSLRVQATRPRSAATV